MQYLVLMFFRSALLALLVVTCGLATAGRAVGGTAEKYWVYVGTYSGGSSKGIYCLEFDSTHGTLGTPQLAGAAVNPSFLAIHPNQKFLYAVGEIGEFKGKRAGGISAFAINAQSGDLTLLNQESSVGTGPCHLVVDRSGKCVLAANYGGGSTCVLPIRADGSVGPASAFVQHRGSSANKQRQAAPHAHSVNVDPGNRFAFVADLGLDQVLVYRLDSAKGTLTANDPPFATLAPGAGPRHFCFHPSGRFAYVINELHSTVTAFTYDADKGTLQAIQTISSIPHEFDGKSFTAEVVAHPNGKFLYGSNRGHNSIAVFTIDQETGKLTFVETQGKGVKVPRNFNVDPTGKYMLVANQDGDDIVVFRVDQETGKLGTTGQRVAVPKPVCVKFLPRS